MQTSVLNTPENKQQVYRLHSYTPELLNSQRNYTIPCASMASYKSWLRRALYNALRQHGLGDLHEASHIGTLHVVHIT